MNDPQRPSAGNIIHWALLLELGLGFLALLISWGLDHQPFGQLDWQNYLVLLRQTAVGIAAALPLFAILVIADQLPTKLSRQLQKIVHQQIAPLFQHTSVGQLLAISLAAGFGEELLFRGLIQAVLSNWIGPEFGGWLGLVVASLLFGMCHWLSATYAMLAAIMGMLLGLLFLVTGNLVAPIAMHAMYDFLALLYLVRWSDTDLESPDPSD